MNSPVTEEMLANFKIKLGKYMTRNEFGDINAVWRTLEQSSGHNLPDWVAARVWIENSNLYGFFSGYQGEDSNRVVEEIEALMNDCGLWYEMENSCMIWLYNEDEMNSLEDAKESPCKS